MDIKCPQHGHLLTREDITLCLSGKEYHCVVGLCPQCNVRYINRQLFQSNIFRINGVRYQYLKKMHKAFPVSQMNAGSEVLARKQGEEKKVHEAREASIAETKERITTGVYKSYHAKEVCFVKKIPAVCPQDGDEILNVKKTRILLHDTEFKTAAHCCIRCGTAYLLQGRKNQFQKKNASEGSENAVLSNEGEGNKSGMDSKIQTLASAIVEAKIRKLGECGTETVIVVTSPEEQLSKEGLYWIGRNLSAAVLFAIQIDPRCQFEYKGAHYEVVSYKGSYDLHKYLRIIARFCDPAAPRTVHIFAHKSVPRFQGDDYEAVTAMIPCAGKVFPVATTVYYEKKTSRYFMNEDT